MATRILLAGSDEAIVRKLRFLFEACGCAVEAAWSREDALSKLSPTPPALILIHANLAGEDGCALASAVRDRVGESVPRIFLFGESPEGRCISELEARKAGANGVLFWPLNSEELRELADNESEPRPRLHATIFPAPEPPEDENSVTLEMQNEGADDDARSGDHVHRLITQSSLLLRGVDARAEESARPSQPPISFHERSEQLSIRAAEEATRSATVPEDVRPRQRPPRFRSQRRESFSPKPIKSAPLEGVETPPAQSARRSLEVTWTRIKNADYFKVLGISEDASPEEVDRAYAELRALVPLEALIDQPELLDLAERVLGNLEHAWAVLRIPALRRAYAARRG